MVWTLLIQLDSRWLSEANHTGTPVLALKRAEPLLAAMVRALRWSRSFFWINSARQPINGHWCQTRECWNIQSSLVDSSLAVMFGSGRSRTMRWSRPNVKSGNAYAVYQQLPRTCMPPGWGFTTWWLLQRFWCGDLCLGHQISATIASPYELRWCRFAIPTSGTWRTIDAGIREQESAHSRSVTDWVPLARVIRVVKLCQGVTLVPEAPCRMLTRDLLKRSSSVPLKITWLHICTPPFWAGLHRALMTGGNICMSSRTLADR